MQPEAELGKSSSVLFYENCMAKLKVVGPRLTVNSCTKFPKTYVTSADTVYSCANMHNKIGGAKVVALCVVS